MVSSLELWQHPIQDLKLPRGAIELRPGEGRRHVHHGCGLVWAWSHLPRGVGSTESSVFTIRLLNLIKHERVIADLAQLDNRIH